MNDPGARLLSMARPRPCYRLCARVALLPAVLVALVLCSPITTARADSNSMSPDPALAAIATAQAGLLAAHLGIPLHVKLAVGWSTDTAGNPFADTVLRDKINGSFSNHGPICQIAVNKGWMTAQPQPTAEQEVLIHEVFHCYENQIAPDDVLPDGTKNEGDWIIEGLARWVDLNFYPSDPVAEAFSNITEYAATSSRTLFNRRYDAVGFWGHLQDVTSALWSRIPAILKRGAGNHDQQAFAAAVGSDETNVLDSWGSSAFELAGEAPPWNTNSPLAGSPVYPLASITKLAVTGGVALKPYSTAQLEVQPRADKPLIEVHLSPGVYGRFGVGENYTDKAITDKVFCAGEGCTSPASECPSGYTSTLPPLTPLPAKPMLGVATGRDAGSADVTYFAAQNSSECHPPAESQTNATSGGDPHMFSFGQNTFDFQAAGEFTLVKSRTSSDLDMQVRQQPVPHSSSLAMNTAIAMRDGKAIVEVDLGGGGGLEVLVDHRHTSKHSESLSGGGSFAFSYGHGKGKYVPVTVTVRWHDGSSVAIESVTGVRVWETVSIRLARSRVGHITGLLGDAGAPPADEFEGKEGKHFSAQAIEDGWFFAPDAQILYGQFGASWRISQHESLFTYAHGKSTRSYTINGFPFRTFLPGALPVATQQHAAAACTGAGITNPALLEDCEYDVAGTGNDEYASGDATMQAITGPGPQPRGGTGTASNGSGGSSSGSGSSSSSGSGSSSPPSTPPPNPGIDLGSGSVTPAVAYDPSSGNTYVAWLDPKVNDVVDVCVVSSGAGTCNGGAGPYKLTDPLAATGGASPAYFGPQVLVQPSGTVVVVVNVDGASPSVEPPGYGFGNGVIAWSSPAGGAAFGGAGQGIATSGKLLANSQEAGDMPEGGAVALDSTHIFTYGNVFPFSSGATDFTLTTPAPSNTPEADKAEKYADQEGANSARIASIPDLGHAGEYLVVAIGTAAGGCKGGSADETGFSFFAGTPSALQTASWPTFKGLACQAHAPVLTGGGPSGGSIGLVDAEGSGLFGEGSDGVYWRSFDTTSDSFSAPVLISEETALTILGPTALSASSDTGGGVYAAWLDSRGVVVDYSAGGGASWSAPVVTGIESGDGVVAGTGGGHAEVAYSYGSQEYLDLSA